MNFGLQYFKQFRELQNFNCVASICISIVLNGQLNKVWPLEGRTLFKATDKHHTCTCVKRIELLLPAIHALQTRPQMDIRHCTPACNMAQHRHLIVRPIFAVLFAALVLEQARHELQVPRPRQLIIIVGKFVECRSSVVDKEKKNSMRHQVSPTS